MKKALIFILSLMLTGSLFSQTIGDTIVSNNAKNLKLTVLYFHITNRCNTCTTIETLVRKTIFENFKTEVDSGIINLSIINCELPENKVISEKYDAYGATLAITFIDGAKEKSEDLSNWAFQKVNKEDIFISELKNKITELLK